jgi:formate/nitrite transporter FocA (FNT family)
VSADDREAFRPYDEILDREVDHALRELRRPASGLLPSAFSAGLDVGFSAVLIAALHTQLEGHLAPSLVSLLGALMYPVGFLFVILGRSELFTEHTTQAAVPVLRGRAPVRALARLWGLVYVGNLAGAFVVAALAAKVTVAVGAVGVDAYTAVARPIVNHPGWVIGASAVLAGWLMGLLSWLVTAARDTTAQVLVVFIVTFAIGLAHLHHSIVGSVEVLAAVFSGDEVTFADYGRFLVWSTLGNAVGGVVFVALIKTAHGRRPGPSL